MLARNSDLARLACASRSLRLRSSAAAARCCSSRRWSSRLIRFMFSASAPNSSRLGILTVTPKFPAATSPRNSSGLRTGRMNDQEMTNPKNIASPIVRTAKPPITKRERRSAAMALARRLAMRACSSGDHLAHEPIDRPVERVLAGGQRVPGVVDLALADEVRDVRHHRHRVVLRRSDLLDQRALVGRRRPLDAGERVVEAVVLAKDLRHRRFVLAHERHRRVVHLERERVLDLL